MWKGGKSDVDIAVGCFGTCVKNVGTIYPFRMFMQMVYFKLHLFQNWMFFLPQLQFLYQSMYGGVCAAP